MSRIISRGPSLLRLLSDFLGDEPTEFQIEGERVELFVVSVSRHPSKMLRLGYIERVGNEMVLRKNVHVLYNPQSRQGLYGLDND